MKSENDTVFPDNHAEQKQARSLRDQARVGGLHFEVYLPPKMADWLLEQIENSLFADPSEAAFVAFDSFISLQPYEDLHNELLRRILQASIDDPRPRIPHDEVFAAIRRSHRQPRPEPAVWKKVQA